MSLRYANGSTEERSKRGLVRGPRGFCGLEDVARSSLDALRINAVEKHDQISRLDRDAGRLGLTGGGEPKGSALQPLVEDEKALGVPEEQLDPIPASVPENDQVTEQGILLEDTLHEMRETVESFP
jgi:hypothetical protein